LRELSEINCKKNAEENHKLHAEEDHDQNTDIAEVLSEKLISSFFNSGGTISLDHSSITTYSLESEGAILL
jgi:hypothetical protein